MKWTGASRWVPVRDTMSTRLTLQIAPPSIEKDRPMLNVGSPSKIGIPGRNGTLTSIQPSSRGRPVSVIGRFCLALWVSHRFMPLHGACQRAYDAGRPHAPRAARGGRDGRVHVDAR